MASKASIAERSQRALSNLSLLMNQVNEEYGFDPLTMPYWKRDAGLEQAMRLETVANWLDTFVQRLGLPGLNTGEVAVEVEEVDTPLLPITPPDPDGDGLTPEVIEVGNQKQSIDDVPFLPTVADSPTLMSEPDPEGTIPPPIIEPIATPTGSRLKKPTPPAKGK